MLKTFKTLSLQRSAWLLLAFFAFCLEVTGLYFQHGMGLVPCVMCVYERLALSGIFIAGLIGVLAPRFFLFRWLALVLWGFSSFKGLMLAFKHYNYQTNPYPWNQCEFKPDFPQTMPFDQWFPNLFASGPVNCSEKQWEMLGLGMPEWLIFAFGVFAVCFILALLSQFKRSQPKRMVFR